MCFANDRLSDPALLEISYQIGKFIHTMTEDCRERKSNFCGGPGATYFQTKKGLVLEEYAGMPNAIHTPYGSWRIGSCGKVDLKIMEIIKKNLGLKFFFENKDRSLNINRGPYWSITKWQDIQIEKPVYKKASEYIEYEEVKEVWKKFRNAHAEDFNLSPEYES